MRICLSVSLVVLSTLGLIPSQAGAVEFPQVAAYRLEASFEPAASRMVGRAEVTLRADSKPSDTVSFFLHGELFVDSILQRDQSLAFAQESVKYDYDYALVGNRVAVELASLDSGDPLTIYYAGHFHPSKARSESDYMRIDPTGVYLRAYYYSAWFPMFESPQDKGYCVDFNYVRLDAPEPYYPVFTGRLEADSVRDGRQITAWSSANTSLDDAQCTAQKFERTRLGDVTVYSWTDSSSVAAAGSVIEFVRRVADSFGDRYSRQAEASELHVIEMPRYGEISSGNVTTICADTWRQFDTETWPKRFLAHELVHPFVRPEVSPEDPLASLVIEGFPKFFHLPVLEQELGRDWYLNFLKRREAGYLKMKATGLSRRGNRLPEEKPIDQIGFDEIGDYKDLFILSDRAPLFLNFLRVKMGEELFLAFGRSLFRGETVTDSSFRELIEQFLPGSGPDVDLWLSGTEYPERWKLEQLTAGR